MGSKGPMPSALSTNRTNNAGGTSPQSHMEIGSKWSYSTLEYPADIQERSDLGHYMMFYVNVANSERSIYSTYYSQKDKQRTQRNHHQDSVEADQTGGLNDSQRALRKNQSHSESAGREGWSGGPQNVWTPGGKERVIKRKSFQGQIGERFGVKRTTRTTDSIVLYMPPTIQTNTNAAYKSSELGGMMMESSQRLWDFVSKADIGFSSPGFGFNQQTLDAAINALDGGRQQLVRELEKGIAKTASALMGGDAYTGLNKFHNRAENRYLEAAFDAVGFRKFSYTFKFTPKNVNESFIARDIIKTFRFHMSPEQPETGDFGRYFVSPAEFDLFYMFRGDENTWLNKISTCVLTNMDVTYANGRYQTFRPVWGSGNEGAPPTEIEMKLDFMETKIITKREIMEGY